MSEPTTSPEPSEIAGRYEVASKLGAGAFGTVYKAKDKLLGRMVAVKTIRLDGLAAQGASLNELLDRFQREARVSAQLKHPNIVTIYDIGEVGGLSYLAMEFIDGVGLDKIVATEGRLPVGRAAAIAAQIADALDYAHAHQVVHRDIKPANVMIEPGDRVKVTDFGIAKTLDSADHLTVTGSLLGTPSYMSPEQARGSAIDGRTDLFALSCILYEMLAGTRAFRGDSITALIFKIITEEPPPLQDLDASIPEEMIAIVRKGLSKAPETRYQTGRDMVADLQAFVTPGATPTLRHVEMPTNVGRHEQETRVSAPTRRVPPQVPSVAPTRLSSPAAPPAAAPPTQLSAPPARSTAPPPMPRPAPARSGSKLGLLLGIAAIGAFLLVVALGVGWLIFRPRPAPEPVQVSDASSPAPAPGDQPLTPATTSASSSPATAPPVTDVPSRPPSAPATAPSPSSPAPTRHEAPPDGGGPAASSETVTPPRPGPRPPRDNFAFLEQPPTEGVDGGAAGRELADTYSNDSGRGSSSSYGTRRQLRRRAPFPPHTDAERPAVFTLLNLARIENAHRRRTGRYGTLSEILSPTRALPPDTTSFSRRGYSFTLRAEGDSFTISATPEQSGLRAFYADDTGIVQVIE